MNTNRAKNLIDSCLDKLESQRTGSWVGTRVRSLSDGIDEGKVIKDQNADMYRTLFVLSDTGVTHQIVLNNVGKNSREVDSWEWYDDQSSKWYSFGW